MNNRRNHLMRALLTGVLPLMLFASCLQEEFTGSPTGKGDADITFSLSLPGKKSASTRALTETDENEVKTIDVLVFKENDGEYVYTARCSGSSITTDGGDSRKKTFTVTLRQGRFDLVILANARDLVPQATLAGKNKQDALALMAVSNTGKWLARNSDSGYKPIPMWGNVGDLTISESTSLTGSNAVKLTRMVSRVDVQVTGTAVNNFKLASVHVYNYNTKGSIAPKSLTAADWDVTTDANAPRVVQPNVPASSTLTKGPLLYDGTAINETDNACASEIYLFEAENHTGTGHATAKALLNRTCLVIGGVYDTDSQPTYYRVDFSAGSGTSQAYLDVLRNHQYIFSINKVSGAGFDDPDTAFESAPVNIEANVLEWNDAQMSEIVFDGQHFLAVTPGEFSFYKDAITSDEGDNRLTIHTDVATGWSIDVNKIVYSPSGTQWLTPSTASGGTTKQTIYLKVDENTSGMERTATIPIKAGRLVYNVVVKQNNTVKKTPVFNFIEYVNVNGTGLSVPLSGGEIQAKVNTNMGWAFRTDNILIMDKSMAEPSSVDASDYTFSVNIPAVGSGDGWGSASTKIWIEYAGAKLMETTFRQLGYNITITGAPTTVNSNGQDVTFNLSGYFSPMNFRAVNVADITKVLSNVVACDLTGNPTANDNSTVTLTIYPNVSGGTRNMKFQYEKSPGNWVDIGTASQEWNNLTLPLSGILASPGVLGVGKTTGKLTLRGSKEFANTNVATRDDKLGTNEFGDLEDETVYVAYYTMGSLIAVNVPATGSIDFAVTDIMWAPPGYDIPALQTRINQQPVGLQRQSQLPRVNGTTDDWPTTTTDVLTGIGNPCTLADKGTATGTYIVSTSFKSSANGWNSWNNTPTNYPWTTVNANGTNVAGRYPSGNWSFFLPAAGARGAASKGVSQGVEGYYHSGTGYGASNSDYGLYFTNSLVNPIFQMGTDMCAPVRCVRQ